MQIGSFQGLLASFMMTTLISCASQTEVSKEIDSSASPTDITEESSSTDLILVGLWMRGEDVGPDDFQVYSWDRDSLLLSGARCHGRFYLGDDYFEFPILYGRAGFIALRVPSQARNAPAGTFGGLYISCAVPGVRNDFLVHPLSELQGKSGVLVLPTSIMIYQNRTSVRPRVRWARKGDHDVVNGLLAKYPFLEGLPVRILETKRSDNWIIARK